jgi:hypothetical protein
MRVGFAGLELFVPNEWKDITDTLPEGSPPTLARETGIGAVQFSVRHQVAGVPINITDSELSDLFNALCKAHSIEMVLSKLKALTPYCLGGTARTLDKVTGIWYLSNGRDIALITYTSLEPYNSDTTRELADAIKMVCSVTFP